MQQERINFTTIVNKQMRIAELDTRHYKNNKITEMNVYLSLILLNSNGLNGQSKDTNYS